MSRTRPLPNRTYLNVHSLIVRSLIVRRTLQYPLEPYGRRYRRAVGGAGSGAFRPGEARSLPSMKRDQSRAFVLAPSRISSYAQVYSVLYDSGSV